LRPSPAALSGCHLSQRERQKGSPSGGAGMAIAMPERALGAAIHSI